MKTLALRGLRSHGEADPVGNVVRDGQIAEIGAVAGAVIESLTTGRLRRRGETAGLDLLAAGEDRS